MGSGCFPIKDARLTEAARLIKSVIDEYIDAVYGGDSGQYDNAASDGGSLALLDLAMTLINNENRGI